MVKVSNLLVSWGGRIELMADEQVVLFFLQAYSVITSPLENVSFGLYPCEIFSAP